MEQDTNYQETGNVIPISFDELNNHIQLLLSKYDKNKFTPNPFKEDIIYTTNEGKTIKIPKETQLKAINQWEKKKDKKNKVVVKDTGNYYNIVFFFLGILIMFILYKMT